MSEARVHIYRAASQPATRFLVDFGDDLRHWFTYRKRSLVWCMCCKRKRWAANAVVQVYYDGNYYFCRKGHGCKP